jgi:hypothetical protein
VKIKGIILSIIFSSSLALWAGPGPTPVAKAQPTPIPYIQKSTVFKKAHSSPAGLASALKLRLNSISAKRTSLHTDPGDYSIPIYSKDAIVTEDNLTIRGPNDYDRLNSDLSDSMAYQLPKSSSSDQIIGAVLGVAGDACAGIAAAQALGVIPSPQQKKK